MQILKLFNAIFFIALFNFSDCIAAKKDSPDQQEKEEFRHYLKQIDNIQNVTPHANAHFFYNEHPLFPPNKTDANKLVLNFNKHNEGYSAFTTPWETVKGYIKTNADEINRSENNQAFTYTVNFENPLPAYKITDILFPDEDCNKDKIEEMARNNGNFLNNPSKIKSGKKAELTNFQKCLKKINHTKQERNVNQARFIVAKAKKDELKTAYPVINPE